MLGGRRGGLGLRGCGGLLFRGREKSFELRRVRADHGETANPNEVEARVRDELFQGDLHLGGAALPLRSKGTPRNAESAARPLVLDSEQLRHWTLA
jgi:hypothetical protein